MAVVPRGRAPLHPPTRRDEAAPRAGPGDVHGHRPVPRRRTPWPRGGRSSSASGSPTQRAATGVVRRSWATAGAQSRSPACRGLRPWRSAAEVAVSRGRCDALAPWVSHVEAARRVAALGVRRPAERRRRARSAAVRRGRRTARARGTSAEHRPHPGSRDARAGRGSSGGRGQCALPGPPRRAAPGPARGPCRPARGRTAVPASGSARTRPGDAEPGDAQQGQSAQRAASASVGVGDGRRRQAGRDGFRAGRERVLGGGERPLGGDHARLELGERRRRPAAARAAGRSVVGVRRAGSGEQSRGTARAWVRRSSSVSSPGWRSAGRSGSDRQARRRAWRRRPPPPEARLWRSTSSSRSADCARRPAAAPRRWTASRADRPRSPSAKATDPTVAHRPSSTACTVATDPPWIAQEAARPPVEHRLRGRRAGLAGRRPSSGAVTRGAR
jgi:hypothetical protein